MNLFRALVIVSIAMLSTSPVTAKRTLKRILHFSDVHLNISQNMDTSVSAEFPIKYFQDAPIQLLESALEYAHETLPNPDFFLYTGDHAAHGAFTDEYIAHAVETNVKTIEKYYPVLGNTTRLETTAIIGNADGNPDYHMEITNPDTERNPSIELISNVWKHSLSKSNFEAFNRKGYLQYQLDEKLFVLTLNTVPYSIHHVPDTSNISDPFDQFAWLHTTLLQFRQKGQYAYIVGHIAPFVDSYGGQPQWHPDYIVKYKALVESFADIVKAQFFGHVHSIEFRIPTTLSVTSQVPLFVSGSISPLFGNNPSFMVWDYDATTYEVVDYYVYGTNISTHAPQLNWSLLFQASKAYGLPGLTSTDLTGLYNRMVENPALLETYYFNMKAQSHQTPPCNTHECRAKTLCTMKWFTTSSEFTECIHTTQDLLDPKPVESPEPTPSSSMPSNKPDILTSSTEHSTSTSSSVNVYETVIITVLVSAIAIAVVLGTLFAMRRYGVLKQPVERERHYENV